MIPAAELASMQGVVESAMPDLCRTVTITRSKDAKGNVTETPALSAPFACSLRALEPDQEGVVVARLDTLEVGVLAHPLSVSLSANDRVEVTVSGQTATYEVQAVPLPESYATHGTVYVVQVA